MAGRKKKPFVKKPNVGRPFDKQGKLADAIRALSGKKMPFDKSLKMKEGGAVPAEFKGFSKLPEKVQQKMNPDLAQKYENGGEVRGAGSAISGRGFKGIR